MDMPVLYIYQDAHIDFAAIDAAGQPIDLTNGYMEAFLQREGIKPYSLVVNTQTNPEFVQWKIRASGTGIITIPLLSADPQPPIGMIKLMLRSVLNTGQVDMQYLSWARIVRIPHV